MTPAPNLDFAIDRALRRRWRKLFFSALGLLVVLQIGLAAWRVQAIEAVRTSLTAQRRQLSGTNASAEVAELSPEKIKSVVGAKAMLDSLSVPWERLLSAVEAARTESIVIETIRPRLDDGSVSITITCTDFPCVAEFIKHLVQQESLSDVMLISETLPEKGAGSLRAIITANWRKFP